MTSHIPYLELHTSNMKLITIAIDGHSSCGKSTMAKDLAKEIGYIYIDTGAMYRAVTLYSLQHGLITDAGINEEALRQEMSDIMITFQLNVETGRPDTYLNGVCVEKEIRTMEVSKYVSPIATLGFVREAMVDLQRLMGEAKGVIMDGRDIGTVVFPDAELKVFVTASVDVRAQRRYDELTAKGEKCNLEDIVAMNVADKAGVVREDENDNGRRQILNYGHTVGHVIERDSGYTKPHGLCVAKGMGIMIDACVRAGTLDAETAERMKALLKLYNLPVSDDITPEAAVKGAMNDKKKRGGTISVILVNRSGEAEIKKITPEDFMRFLSK